MVALVLHAVLTLPAVSGIRSRLDGSICSAVSATGDCFGGALDLLLTFLPGCVIVAATCNGQTLPGHDPKNTAAKAYDCAGMQASMISTCQAVGLCILGLCTSNKESFCWAACTSLRRTSAATCSHLYITPSDLDELLPCDVYKKRAFHLWSA